MECQPGTGDHRPGQACGQHSLTVTLSSDSVGVHSQGDCAPEGGGGRLRSSGRKAVESFL